MQDRKAIFREEAFAVGLLASLWGVAILVPLLHMLTRWLSFADYDLPAWAGCIGVATFAEDIQNITLLCSILIAFMFILVLE